MSQKHVQFSLLANHIKSSTWTLFILLAMITHSAVQSSTLILFTLLAMITHSAVQSSTLTLFTLLAMITHLAVQSSTWTLFTMVSVMSSIPTGCNFIFLRHFDGSFVQKFQKCQICVIYENLDCRKSNTKTIFYEFFGFVYLINVIT